MGLQYRRFSFLVHYLKKITNMKCLQSEFCYNIKHRVGPYLPFDIPRSKFGLIFWSGWAKHCHKCDYSLGDFHFWYIILKKNTNDTWFKVTFVKMWKLEDLFWYQDIHLWCQNITKISEELSKIWSILMKIIKLLLPKILSHY